MTDDLVARLRHEQELCAIMGDTKAGALVGEAADRLEALEIKERESFQKFVDANEARIDAEARVRELEAEVAAMEARAVAADLAVVKAAKVATTEAYERAAEVADCHADECDAASFASTVAEQVSALRSKEQAAHEIATAIRQLAQEVKHEAE